MGSQNTTRRSTLFGGVTLRTKERRDANVRYIFGSGPDRYLHCRSRWIVLHNLREKKIAATTAIVTAGAEKHLSIHCRKVGRVSLASLSLIKYSTSGSWRQVKLSKRLALYSGMYSKININDFTKWITAAGNYGKIYSNNTVN